MNLYNIYNILIINVLFYLSPFIILSVGYGELTRALRRLSADKTFTCERIIQIMVCGKTAIF